MRSIFEGSEFQVGSTIERLLEAIQEVTEGLPMELQLRDHVRRLKVYERVKKKTGKVRFVFSEFTLEQFISDLIRLASVQRSARHENRPARR